MKPFNNHAACVEHSRASQYQTKLQYAKSLSQYYMMMMMMMMIYSIQKNIKIDYFLVSEARSAEYKHKTTAKWLFYAPHVAKRPSKRSG